MLKAITMRNTIFIHLEFILTMLMITLFNVIPETLLAFTTNNTYIPNSTSGNHSNYIAWVICNIIKELTGPIGQAVSTVAVIFIGVGLFMGKISWGLALGIAVGMGMLFGAENVVGWISGQDFACIDMVKPF